MFENSRILLSDPDTFSTLNKNNDLLDKLTRREYEVLTLLAIGMTRDMIADKLYISPETVKMHTKNLYKKLHAKNKIDALIKAQIISSGVKQ